MELIAALAAHPDFSRLDPEDIEVLGKAFSVDSQPTGHVFIEEGDRAGAAWLLLEGEVAVTRARDPYIDELVRLREGAMFGLASLVSDERRGATCRAATPVTTGRIDRFALDLLMQEHAPVGLALQRAVARQLAADFRNVGKHLRDLLEKRG